VAYTTQVGRQAMRYRRAVVCRTVTDAARELNTIHPANAVDESITRPVVFMFTGQGSQYVQMGQGLYRTQPIFREHVDQCSALLQSMLGYDLRSLLYPTTADHSEATRELNQTRTTQPALFVIEYALARLWMSWGVRPQAMIGHSIGEYVAACLAGVLTLEDALKLVVTRARFMQEMPPGSMLGVSLGETDARALLNQELSLATINRPDRCVISGPTDAVQELTRQLGKIGVPYQLLHTSHAFHSHMMEPIIDPFVEHVKTVTLNAPQIPYISNVTGKWITAAEATDPEYWGRHLRQAVRFSDGVQELLKEPNHVLLEVGPGTTLTTLAKQQGTNGQIPTVVSSLRHPNQKQDDEFVILQALAQLFLAGVEINWSAVHDGTQCRRVQLPTYPFERARYWVESSSTGDDESESAPDERRALDDWFYVPDWKRTVPAANGRSDNDARQKTRLLMFADTCGLADAVSEIFCAEGRELIKVSMGEDFARLDQESYTINVARPEDYTKLFADLRERSLLPDRVVHLWSVTAGAEQLPFEETQRRGFYSLLWLARAAAANSDVLHIAVVTNDMQAASTGETLNANKATVLGGCKVIPQEYSNINCRSIDVILPAAGDTRRGMVVAEQLASEIDSDEREPVVAYRGPYRLVQSYERVHLKPSNNDARGLREGGVYLITGGMGGIGYTLAKYLAESVRAKLILVSRNALPDSKPGERLENQDGRMAQVKTLEDLGAEVLVINADVADEAELRAAIDRATVRFGRIHGVIHAAGVAGGGVIQFKTEDEVARVWAPKIKGALLLDAAFKDDQLDFLIFCSSVKSMLAEFGQSDYCSASIFLDTLAHSLRFAGVEATSINWDTWREVGMAVNSQSEGVLGVLQEQNLSLSITPVEGIEVFERVLTSRLPQVVVSVRDLESRMVNRNASASLLEQLGDAVQNSPSYPRPQLSTPYVAPGNALEQKIADVWQRILGIQQIGVHDNFFDLGGDSLTAVQVATQLKKEFGVPIPVVKLFEGPTISSLAGILDPKTEANPAFARRQERGARRRERRKALAASQS